MSAPQPISDLAERLRPHLADIATNLFPDKTASRTRSEMRFGNKGGLVVYLSAPRAGKWRDFDSGEYGDALDLITRELGSRDQALDYARRWLGEDTQVIRKPLLASAARRSAADTAALLGPPNA